MSIPLHPNPAPPTIEAAVAVLGKDGRPILDITQALDVLAALEDEAVNEAARAAREVASLQRVLFEEAADYQHELEAAEHAAVSATRRATLYAAFSACLEVQGQAWAGELPDPWAPLLWREGGAHDRH